MTDASRPRFPFALLRFWFRRTLLMWSLIAFMIFIIQVIVCSLVRDSASIKTLIAMLDLLPSFVKQFIGGESLKAGNVAAFVAIGYQHPLVLILFMVYAVGVPSALLAGEVQEGTMELILSRSITKTQAYLCAGILTVVGMFALNLVMFSGTAFSVWIIPFEETVPLYPFFITAMNGGLVGCAVGAITLLAAAAFRLRGTAVGVAVAYLVVTYLMSIIAEWWPRLAFLSPLTLFHYVGDGRVFSQRIWPASDMCVLATVVVVVSLAGGIVWNRRDLPM